MAEVAKGIIDVEINTGGASAELKSLQAQINAFFLTLNKNSKNQGLFSREYSKELQNAINNTGIFTAETVKLTTAAATLDKTLSKGKVSLGQFFSAKFSKNSAVAAETMALAAERARRMQTQFIATSAAANGMQEALAVRPLAAFSSELAIASERSQILSSMFKQGTTQLINFGKNVQWAGRQLMVGFTVPLTIFGNVAGKTFMELEKQVVSFKKVYGDLFTTPAELNQNLEAVKGLAAEYTKYGIAVKDTIGLAAQAAAAGRKNADLTDAVAQATRLATLGQMDQNSALETTISLQSAFRLSGKELADTINFLNMVENQTVVSLQDLAAAIPRVAPVIQGLGGDVKDLSVFLAAMQEGGVDAAEGANALKSGLASLINPTKQATQMLSGMGINLQAIIDANKGDLMGTVMAFSQALAALDQFSRQQALEQVFGKFQYAKLGALFDNISRQGSQAQQVIATMGYTTEQLGATAEKELKTIEESFGVQLTGAVERFKLAIAPIGEIFIKIAIPIVNFITGILEKFNSLSEGKKQFIAIAAAIVGVVIPAATMFLGLLMNLSGTLLKMFQGLGAFTKGFVTGGPLGAIKALTQSSKYLSLAEIDAAMAAQQLAGATEAVNAALLEQAASAGLAATGIDRLLQSYRSIIATQGNVSNLPPFTVGASAARGVKSGQLIVQRRNAGGPIFMSNGSTVPGTGNTDTVPALLTPGEFVVNKQATAQNFDLLNAINGNNIQKFRRGGMLKAQSKMWLPSEKIRSISPSFTGKKPEYQIKGTAGIFIDDITDPAILRKYPSFVKDGRISSNSLNGRMTEGLIPAELLIAGMRAYRGSAKTSSQHFLNALQENGILSSKEVSRVYDAIERTYIRAIIKKGVVGDKVNPLWNISNNIIKKELSNNPEALRLWEQFSKSIGAKTSRDSRSTSATRISLTRDNGEILQIKKLQAAGTSKFAHATTPLPLVKEISRVLSGSSTNVSQARNVLNTGEEDLSSQILAANAFNNRDNQYKVGGLAGKNLSARRRQRLSKKERLDKFWALDRWIWNSGNVRENPKDLRTIMGLMNPLGEARRLYRGTVIGSKASKELPYAQQKRVMDAIQQGRYEDLFGMKLNFGAGPSSFTKKRGIDFGKFIGMGNPTINSFNNMWQMQEYTRKQLEVLKKEALPYIRKNNLIPGTDEYRRVMAKYGWTNALIPTNPTSNWTMEDYIAYEQRSLQRTKAAIKKQFPDNKIQQVIIDELVGSGVLSLDMQKEFRAKKPTMRGGRSKLTQEEEVILGKRNSTITGVASDIATRLPVLITKSLNKGGILRANNGTIVPGMGNKDTVPAMLTPGEFVVNKEATKQNLDLLHSINNGTLTGYNDGNLVIPGMPKLPQGPSSSLNNQQDRTTRRKWGTGVQGKIMAASMGGFGLSMAGQMSPNSVIQNTSMIAGTALSMLPVLQMLQPQFAALAVGVGLVGVGMYKLNKSVNEAAGSGAKLAEAMYSTTESVNQIAAAFGRQTLAQQSFIASAEAAGGAPISEEAQSISSQFMKTDIGKKMVQEISLVEAKGEDAAQALTNKLSQAIISGAITPEEAKAIAVDIGAALQNESIAVDVSANIRRLVGPDGKNITKNILQIQAEALPKVDLSVLEKDAQEAYDNMNIFQKAWSNFTNGSFTQQYKLEEISKKNNAIMSAQLNTVEYLNAALKQGSISFSEYISNIEQSKALTQEALNTNAQALGAADQEDLIKKAEEQRKSWEDKKSGQDSSLADKIQYALGIGKPKELKAIDEQKNQVRKMLEETGSYSEEAINKIMDDFSQIGDTSWGKLLTGEWRPTQNDVILNFKSQTVDGKPVDVDDVMTKLNALKAVEGIELAVDVEGLEKSAEGVNRLYNEYVEFEKLSDVEKKAKFETEDAQNVLDKIGASYSDLAKLPDIQKTVFLRYIEQYVQLGKSAVGSQTAMQSALKAGDSDTAREFARQGKEYTDTQKALEKEMQDAIKVQKELEKALGLGTDTGGGGGKNVLDNLKNRFDLVDSRLSMEARKYQDVISLQQRQNELDQRSIEQNQRALQQLSKQEDAINDSYEARISALDGVTRANDRLRQQEQSRISLAAALASGDIAKAASTMSEISAAKTANEIEDAKAALELQRETDLKNLKVEINGQLFTKEQINLRIDAIEENIYQRNLKIRDAQDSIYNIEQERLKNSREREKVETKLFLLEQQKAIIELKRKKVGKGGISAEEASWLKDYKDSYNQMVTFFNSTYGENLQQVKMYGGKINKMAFGGVMYKGSNEPPPALKMAFGSVVPGLGNTDRVPALLTPGEFVIRKSVAQANMPLLEMLNNGITGPSYNVPKSDFGVKESSVQQNTGIVYNDTYSINVNVAGTNASPEDIANVVLNKLSKLSSGNVRGIRY